MMISVSMPRIAGSSVGSSKPALSRSNQAGPATAAITAKRIASAAADRQHAAVPAADEEGHHEVDEDVGERDDLRALELRPAADA